ncbi:histidine kinase [Marinoscillum pacificum]|uniref:histidine kinase n=1 Tax=Marinoscillum pacificum TaxID=392723 RepID=UPI00215835D9|nr:histidine kinase [Marinoscillum pacificum]
MSDVVKILYVDDERGNIDYFRSVFRREYEIVTANSGEEGLEILLKNQDIPVILTDQRMPRMTGVEFLRKSIDIARDSIRILVTGYADMETVINAVNLGHIYYYISKPWTYDEMQIIIKRAIETYRLRSINKELLIRSERMEKERVVAQLENLRNQVNPHFLFNCLNTLHALVHDNDTARQFVKNLASTYRYLLEHSENLVPLVSEISFVENYIHLQRVRFKDAFDFEMNIDDLDKDFMIPSASLQLLVENTLKHNKITKENPLTVSVFVEDGWLIVKNKYQPKESKRDSTGIGQKNLLARMSYLSLPAPEFYLEGEFYISKIPLLKDKS